MGSKNFSRTFRSTIKSKNIVTVPENSCPIMCDWYIFSTGFCKYCANVPPKRCTRLCSSKAESLRCNYSTHRKFRLFSSFASFFFSFISLKKRI